MWMSNKPLGRKEVNCQFSLSLPLSLSLFLSFYLYLHHSLLHISSYSYYTTFITKSYGFGSFFSGSDKIPSHHSFWHADPWWPVQLLLLLIRIYFTDIVFCVKRGRKTSPIRPMMDPYADGMTAWRRDYITFFLTSSSSDLLEWILMEAWQTDQWIYRPTDG